MLLRRSRSGCRTSLMRAAFTNTELLVVAAIALVLLGLIAATVGKIYELLKSWQS
jgi:hypothetical protein